MLLNPVTIHTPRSRNTGAMRWPWSGVADDRPGGGRGAEVWRLRAQAPGPIGHGVLGVWVWASGRLPVQRV